MSTNEEGTPAQTKWAKVTTPLQYLALTHKQLLVFYGSVITVGTVTQRPFLASIALVLAGLPQLSMLVLSVVDREALKALGEDASQRKAVAEGEAKPETAGSVASNQLQSGAVPGGGKELPADTTAAQSGSGLPHPEAAEG